MATMASTSSMGTDSWLLDSAKLCPVDWSPEKEGAIDTGAAPSVAKGDDSDMTPERPPVLGGTPVPSERVWLGVENRPLLLSLIGVPPPPVRSMACSLTIVEVVASVALRLLRSKKSNFSGKVTGTERDLTERDRRRPDPEPDGGSWRSSV